MFSSRLFTIVASLALLLIATSEAFMITPPTSFVGKTSSVVATPTALEASRVNAKKEKRQRNRENMRKFQQKRGTSRRKAMKKIRSNEALRIQAEFLAKCFTTTSAPNSENDA